MKKIFGVLFAGLYSFSAIADDFNQPYNYEPISVPEGVITAPISFSGLIYDRVILKTTFISREGENCKIVLENNINEKKVRPIDQEATERFFASGFTYYNYNVAGGNANLFVDESADAKYFLAGRITKYVRHICDYKKTGILGRVKEYMGQVDFNIEWQLYDPVNKQVIYRKEIPGRHASGPIEEPPIRKVTNEWKSKALANSFEGLLSEQEFYNIVAIQNDTPQEFYEGMALKINLSDNTPNDLTLASTVNSVVLIQAGAAHGSGFIVSEDGYILTNQHVVGSFDKVDVTLDNGLKVNGDVIRRDAERDVALIKLPISGLKPLPVKTNRSNIGERIYAIGAPVDTSLQGSISSGIVSTYRISEENDLPLMQSDMVVNGGNSGGPVVNENNEVVAIVVSKIRDIEGISFFIPIDSALERLNLTSSGSD